MTFVIVTGGIDLSVGSILGLTAILLGVFWKNVGLPLAASPWSRGAGRRRSAGLVNGFIITRFRVPPLIATLATLALYRGLAEGISQARSVRGYPEWFFVFGQGELLGVPIQLWLLGHPAPIAAAVMLGLTTFGRDDLCHRHQRDGRALLRPAASIATKLCDLYGCSGLVAGLAARHLRLARLHHPLRHGHRARARRHHRAWCSAAPSSSAAAARSSARCSASS